MKLLNYRLSTLAWYFLFYSFIGWCIETVYVSSLKNEYMNTGFLIGPFIPIYGFGALTVIILLKPVKHNIFIFFIGAAIFTTVLEYITGSLLELVFNNTWWDYSSTPFNLQGRICLRNSVIWGFASIVLLYFVHPFIRFVVKYIPKPYKNALSYFVVLYFLTDAAVVTISQISIQPDLRHFDSVISEITSRLEHIRAMFTK